MSVPPSPSRVTPDFSRLERVLRRSGVPDTIPLWELYSNIEGEVLDLLGIEPELGHGDAAERHWRRHIAYQTALGYDYANLVARGFGFPLAERRAAATAEGQRTYFQADSHTVASWEDFDAYPWPDMSAVDWSLFEQVPAWLPDGMKIIASTSGVLENVMWLLGYEGISYLLHDDPSLVAAMFERVGERLVAYHETVASMPIVGAVCMGDDLGFKTQTLVPPEVLRQYVFPLHAEVCAAAHRHGKLAILHCCGNLEEVIDDVIGCGWDAKHSFEDGIQPVWEAKAAYGDRISLLGGFDVDRIARASVDEVRRHTRFLIERCWPGGGWALGTGNSVCNYIPVENFLAMLDEGRRATG